MGLAVTQDILNNATDYTWEILAIKDSPTETKDLYVERNRIGSIVMPMHSFVLGIPLTLSYFGGAKHGGGLLHSLITKITSDETTVKVYTKNTMYHLKIVSKWY